MLEKNQQKIKPQAYYARKKSQKMKPQAYNARKKLTENEAPCLLCEEQERHTDRNTNKHSKRSRTKQLKKNKTELSEVRGSENAL